MAAQSLQTRYFALLKEHVATQEEELLVAAANLGHELVLTDIPPEEIVEIHHEALSRLARECPDLTLLDATRLVTAPLLEMFMAYGLAYRERLEACQRAERALRVAEENYRTLVEQANDAITVVQHGKRVYQNAAFEKLLGYSLEEAAASSFLDIIAPEERDGMQAYQEQRLCGTAVPEQYEIGFIARDGRRMLVEVRPCVITYNDELAIMAVMRDVTERKQMEEAHRRLAAAVEQSAEIVMVTDTDGTIQYVNPAFERITGYTHREAIGQNPRILKSGKQDVAFYQDLWTTLRRGAVWRGCLTNKRKNGTFYEVQMTISPVYDTAGTLINYVSVQRDVTHEVALEAQLRQAQKMEAVGALAGGIAHDFNNILGAILGYAELAMHDIPPDTLLWRNLREIQTAGRRATDLVRQILTFSRQRDQERQPVQLHFVVQEALTLLRASLPATIDIQQHITRNAGVVCADLSQIHQVLMNLGANAAHAMRDAGGVLHIGLEAVEVDDVFAAQYPALHPGPYVRLTVRDTGHGMAPEVLERIFEPFFTTKEVGEGTGLGLSVVHGIIAGHDGAITVQSTPGAGSTFEIYIPQIAETAEHHTRAEEPLPHGTGCLLFVDDEVMLARVGQALLEHLGYEVVARTSSIEALEAFRAMPQRFDVVITDHTMPNMTGEQLARELRRIRPDIPIILCTGFSHTIDARKALALGIDAFCMKPLVARDLAGTIQQVLAQRATQSAQTEAPGARHSRRNDTPCPTIQKAAVRLS